ncbi:MAG: IclR family transcriptional regulator [Methylobacter sp.]|nr:MAG: IclR family transcriptional regulator [Methylobacter sp.]
MQDDYPLLHEVKACRLCLHSLPHEPRPVLQWHPSAKILLAGQAPGRKVHESGQPFTDASGERLRGWLGIGVEDFYDAQKLAIVPMGLCYPGTDKAGDLPPRSECAPQWRERLLAPLINVRLTLLIGQYAQAYHLPGGKQSVTDAVGNWRAYWPGMVPLPHPSPRNNRWLKQNPWFEAELLPVLRAQISHVLAGF